MARRAQIQPESLAKAANTPCIPKNWPVLQYLVEMIVEANDGERCRDLAEIGIKVSERIEV
jgi:hypothetical protein